MKKISIPNWILVDGIFATADRQTHWFTPNDELMHDNMNSFPKSGTVKPVYKVIQ